MKLSSDYISAELSEWVYFVVCDSTLYIVFFPQSFFFEAYKVFKMKITIKIKRLTNRKIITKYNDIIPKSQNLNLYICKNKNNKMNTFQFYIYTNEVTYSY